jgi:hypothetical protein
LDWVFRSPRFDYRGKLLGRFTRALQLPNQCRDCVDAPITICQTLDRRQLSLVRELLDDLGNQAVTKR